MRAGHDYTVAGGAYGTGTPARRAVLTAPTGNDRLVSPERPYG